VDQIYLTAGDFYPFLNPPKSLAGVYDPGDTFLAVPKMVEVLEADYKLSLEPVTLFNTSGGIALEDATLEAYKVLVLPREDFKDRWAYKPKTLYPILGELNTFLLTSGKNTNANVVKGVLSALKPLRNGSTMCIRPCVVRERLTHEMYFAYSLFTYQSSEYKVSDIRSLKHADSTPRQAGWEGGWQGGN